FFCGGAPQVADDLLAGVSGAEYEYPAAALGARELMEQSPAEPRTAHAHDQQNRVDDENRSRIRGLRQPPQGKLVEQARTGGHADDDVAQVPDAGVSPEALEQLERRKRDQANRDEPRQRLPEHLEVVGRN